TDDFSFSDYTAPTVPYLSPLTISPDWPSVATIDAISMYDQGWDRMAAGEVWNRGPRRGNIRPGGPYIGVQGANGFEIGKGAMLGRVYPDTPASEAGMRQGDVIISFDRSPIGSFGDLAEVVGNLEPGDRVPVVLMRQGVEIEMKIVIGKAGGAR
ncbi:MAG: PDZ domain-containing protein, partial [Phycisphaeraceae bacterium]